MVLKSGRLITGRCSARRSCWTTPINLEGTVPAIRKKTKTTVTRPDLQGGEQHELMQQLNCRHLNEKISETKVEIVGIESVKPNPRNPKKHPDSQIEILAANIQKFGFTTPLLVDEESTILAGHARHLAGCRVGISHVPIIRLLGLSALDKRALAIADNKVAELGDWDIPLLRENLEVLFDPDAAIDFDPRIVGFETVEVDQIISSETTNVDLADKLDPPDNSAPPISRNGDVWICAGHKVACGNALEERTFFSLMGDARADVVFTDSPYNVPNAGHVSGRAGIREFAMASGEMTAAEFTEFLSTSFRLISTFSREGAVLFLCMDWRHMPELQAATFPVFGAPRNLAVWVKTNAGMGSFYRSQHELVLVLVNPGGRATNNFGLGGKGRYRTNVWTYPGCNSFGTHRDAALAMHPTVKPVALVADALMDCSDRRDIVLDPFGGSGTTMIAAERTGRLARLIEIDPIYVDVTVRRWETLTQKSAVLVETGQTFAEVALRRQQSHEQGQ